MNIRQAAVGAVAIDVGAIVVFAAIGRARHDEGVLGDSGLGLATTVWPFVVGALIGWWLIRGWKKPCAWKPTGLAVWAGSLAIGMTLRAVTGQGVQWSFVLTAALVLAVFLIGWRIVSGFIAKRRGLK